MNKQTVIILSAVIIILLGAGFWFTQKQPQTSKYTGPIETITVANVEEYSTLVWVAEEQGFFAENRLAVTTKDYRAGKLAADALLAGEADISVSAEFVLVSNGFDNPDLRALGTVDTVENMELIARKDSGISQVSDLKGKKVGVTKKSVGEFFLGTFLTFHNMTINDIEIVDLNPTEIVESLGNGDIDAGLTWQPNVFRIKQKLGNGAISWSGQSGQRYNMVLIAREKFINDNPETIKRFIDAIVQAEEFVKMHNADTKKLIAEKYNYESSFIDAMWPQHDFVVTLSQTLLLVMEDQALWRIGNNLTNATEAPNYLDYIYTDALEAVKPKAMTIIK